MQGPTFNFTGEILQINTPLAQMRIRWRPTPQAEKLVPGWRKWRGCRPDFRLIRPLEACAKQPAYSMEVQADITTQEVADQKAAAFAAFREQLSPEIVQAVENFGSYQWALMVLMDQEPWAMDLAKGNPVLAYALANSDQLRESPPEAAAVQARWYCHRKQRDLLAWLGFPGTEAVVRIIRKIPPESASPSILRCLRNALKADNRVMENLSRLKVVNAAVLELVIIQPYLDLFAPRLLAEVAEKPPKVSVADIIREGMAILRQFDSERRVKPFTSLKQVCRFREWADEEHQAHLRRQELARQVARRQQEEELAALQRRREWQNEISRRPFPPPPLPGTQDIIPLTSAEQLRAEGVEQRHCVGAYDWRAKYGNIYFYRVMAPERATLAIILGADGCWRRSELRGKGNRKVSPATERSVDMWLERLRISI